MRIDFAGGAVWPEITKACRTKGPRLAAIAYVGVHAPDLLPLRRGDVLVCDASDGVLLGRGTSPEALQAFLDRGVRVLSYGGLHAKVLVTSSVAVIGSANASHHSTVIDEAVVVTDSPAVMAKARAFINGLVAATPVDEHFVEAARVMWERGRHGPMADTRRASADHRLVPRSFRMYLTHPEFYEPSKSEVAVYEWEARRARRQAGPATIYELDSYRIRAGAWAFRPDDVLLQIDLVSPEPVLLPPTVVISEAVPFRGGSRLHLTKGLAGLEPVPLDEAKAALVAAGVNAQLHRERWVRSKRVQDALLGLWGLATSP